MVFKKFGQKLRKIKKLGNKVVHTAAIGARKVGGTAMKGGEILRVVGEKTGNAQLMEAGSTFEQGGEKLRKVARGVEKIRKGKNTQGAEMIGDSLA